MSSLLKVLLAKQLFKIPTMVGLVVRIKEELSLFLDCSFTLEQAAPSETIFCRLFQKSFKLYVCRENCLKNEL